MVVVVCGVAGSGKTTVGRSLAERMDVAYAEGDDFHSEANRLRMAAGRALSDADRGPWLEQIRNWIDGQLAAGESGVITCSALKRGYRRRLARPGVRLVYLKVDQETVERRLSGRRGHFFPAVLVQTQFGTLEEPEPGEDVLVVDGRGTPEAVLTEVLRRLAERAGSRDEGDPVMRAPR